MYKTEAIVLRRRDLKEADKLLTLYTNGHGKLTVRAIGAKKIHSKLGGHVEPFMRTQVCVVESRTIDILAGAQVVDSFAHVRQVVPATHAAQFLVETVDSLTPDGQQEPSVYDLLQRGLEFLNANTDNLNFFSLQTIVMKLLGQLGFDPNTRTCVFCGLPLVPTELSFSAEAGGGVHGACAPHIPDAQAIEIDTLKAIRFAVEHSLNDTLSLRISPTIWKQLNTCIDQLLQAHIRRPLQSRVFLAQAV